MLLLITQRQGRVEVGERVRILLLLLTSSREGVRTRWLPNNWKGVGRLLLTTKCVGLRERVRRARLEGQLGLGLLWRRLLLQTKGRPCRHARCLGHEHALPEGVCACGLRYKETSLLRLNEPCLLRLCETTKWLLRLLLLLSEWIDTSLLRQDKASWLGLHLLRNGKWLGSPKLLLTKLLLLLLEWVEGMLLLEVRRGGASSLWVEDHLLLGFDSREEVNHCLVAGRFRLCCRCRCRGARCATGARVWFRLRCFLSRLRCWFDPILRAPIRNLLVGLVFYPVLLEVGVVEILLQRSRERDRGMSEIRNRNVQKVLQFLRHTEIFDDLFCFITEMPIYGQSVRCVYLRHLEIVL